MKQKADSFLKINKIDKKTDTSQLRDIIKILDKVLLKTVKFVKNKQSLRNYHSQWRPWGDMI